QHHVAGERRDKPEERAQERRLAAAVRTQEADDLARREVELESLAHHAVGESEAEVAGAERHGRRTPAARSAMKTGVPTKAVTTPGGTSVGKSVRHAVSTPSMNAAPSRIESGISRAKAAPTRSRAACGTARPTQPIVPASETAHAVARVAATITTRRMRRTFTPRLAASSSERARTSMRQRSAQIAATAAAMGARVPGRSRGSAPVKLPRSQKVIAGNWLYGSARYFTSATPAPQREPTTTPVSTRVRIG